MLASMIVHYFGKSLSNVNNVLHVALLDGKLMMVEGNHGDNVIDFYGVVTYIFELDY